MAVSLTTPQLARALKVDTPDAEETAVLDRIRLAVLEVVEHYLSSWSSGCPRRIGYKDGWLAL